MYKKLTLAALSVLISSSICLGGKKNLIEAIYKAKEEGRKIAVVADPQGIIRAKVVSQYATASLQACDSKNERIGDVPLGYFANAELVANTLQSQYPDAPIEYLDKKKLPYFINDVNQWEKSGYGLVIIIDIAVLYVPELSENRRATNLTIENRLHAKEVNSAKFESILSNVDLGSTESDFFKHDNCYEALNQFESFITKSDLLIEPSIETTKEKINKILAKEAKKYSKSNK